MVLKLLLVVVMVVLSVLLMAATKPAIFHIEKSVTAHAPPGKVFALIEDFQNASLSSIVSCNGTDVARIFQVRNPGICAPDSTGSLRQRALRVPFPSDWRHPDYRNLRSGFALSLSSLMRVSGWERKKTANLST
jgi:hypothetical protein